MMILQLVEFTKLQKFVLAVAIQLVIIFAIIIFKVAIFIGGSDIVLKIEPVDPRDPLRGDYVAFQYGISNLPSYLARDPQIARGDTVYVVLQQSGKYWFAQGVQKNRPSADPRIFLKGRVASGGGGPGGARLHVVYGMEEYFIPEGKGRDFSFQGKEVAARVVVDENGNAVLKQLYVDDQPWP